MQTDNKYVVRLRDAAIYHADDPFGSRPEKKLLRRGEMVLSEINLSVAPGEFVYLIGRVGSGKSSLLKTLYAEMQLLTGEGYVAGFNLRKLRRRDIPYLRRRIGIVFQDYQLLTDRNVFMNLYYVMKATGWKREQEIRERIDQVLGLDLLKKAEAKRAEQAKATTTASAGGYTVTGEGDAEIDALVLRRGEAKKAKNFAEADAIRDELKARGIEVTDVPGGAVWKRL